MRVLMYGWTKKIPQARDAWVTDGFRTHDPQNHNLML